MALTPEQIQKLVDRVVERVRTDSDTPTATPLVARSALPIVTQSASSSASVGVSTLERTNPSSAKIQSSPAGVGNQSGIFTDLDRAVKAAHAAQPVWANIRLESRKVIIEKLRAGLRQAAQWMSDDAVQETGLGRAADKVQKNLLVINKTPGPEILESQVFTGDDGLTLTEYASYGVIGSITPTTNPTETIINNGISIISAGNAVVFNPHPSAKKVCAKTIALMNELIIAAGGPPNVLTVTKDPTIESAKELMRHPLVRLMVVTGGPGVVREAMLSGKKVIGAGPGNPPVVVDETADIPKAARDIIAGASLDNNIVCIVEKEIIAVSAIADDLMKHMQALGAYKLSAEQTRRLEKVIVDGKYPTKKFVGKNANVILREIGVSAPDDLRLIFCEVPNEDHPFVQVELLMPVIPLVRAPNVHEAIDMAVRMEHGYGHTAVMHSRDISHLSKMAKLINTSIFVKNAPSYAGLGMGGEGYTSFTIASPTGEGLTTARDFSRVRRCTLKDYFRIV